MPPCSPARREHFTEMQISSNPQSFSSVHVAHGAFHQRFAREAAVLFEQVLFQRAAVDADADGNATLLRQASATSRTRAAAPMLPGLMRSLSTPPATHGQRQLIVKMNVRHQRNMDARLMGPMARAAVLRGNRHPDDLAARLLRAGGSAAAVASTFSVTVLHMDWMLTGAPPPTATPPTMICLLIVSPLSVPASTRR